MSSDLRVRCGCVAERIGEKRDARPDMVNNPPHYARLNPQPIDVIEAWRLDFHRAQVLKYISRAGVKDPNKELEDLEKAAFYLNRRINQLRKK